MNKAFSLVELSIVLVILGLLVGGVLTGQSLIRAAELRSISTDFQRYQTATLTFRDRFFALPGDMRNATDFWGEAAAPATCGATPSTGTETCNGNGDGEIAPLTQGNERFRFWQHLANAGLIEGSYTGVGSPTIADTNAHAPGINSPSGRLSNSGWSVHTIPLSSIAASSLYYDREYGNVIYFGRTIVDNFPIDPILTAEEMWNIDTKLDDGLPATGRVSVFRFNTCADSANDTDVNAPYALDNTANICAAIFTNAF